MKRPLRFFLVAAVLFGFVCTGAWLIQKGYLRFNYPSWETYPIRGIDISHHQGTVRWDQLKKQRLSFVYLKATEGSDLKDPRFFQNRRGADGAGLKVGAYHFFSFCRPAEEQAVNFIRVVQTPLALPPAIDVEFGGNCSRPPSKEIIRSEIKEMSERLNQHFGQLPVLYLTTETYEEFYENRLPDNPIWIRDIFTTPQIPRWTFWQFANRGRIEGIQGPVDLNVFGGQLPDWMNLAAGPLVDPD